MILGFNRIIDAREMVVGRFYLGYDYNSDPILFQCVQVGELPNGNPDLRSLRFAPETSFPIGLEAAPYRGPLVALPDVHIRIDAPSMVGTSHTSAVRAGMFIVAGDEAFVAAPTEFRGWTLMNLATGQPAPARFDEGWIAFSRWLLVIEDNLEEIPIASFGQDISGN